MLISPKKALGFATRTLVRRGSAIRNQVRRPCFRLEAQRNMSPRREGLGQPKGYSPSSKSLRYIVEEGAQSGLPEKMSRGEPFLVLGIESSCDDTGASVVRSDGTILSNVVYSQHEIHEKFGGIVPSLAMNEHAKNIEVAVAEALEQAGLESIEDIDAIAVTKGPGLEICLRIGCRKAQKLAIDHDKPFVTVHHLEAHCFMARMAGKIITEDTDTTETETETETEKSSAQSNTVQEGGGLAEPHLKHFTPKVNFPFLALLVSGGHTSLLVCRGLGNYEVLGGTLDDSVGESFDKAARLLGLRSGGSGGAAIEATAKMSSDAVRAAEVRQKAKALLKKLDAHTHATDGSGSGSKGNGKGKLLLEGADKDVMREYRRTTPAKGCEMFSMKVPMREKKGCDFSYAGLKNSFRMAVNRARVAEGLAAEGTNAPANQMEEIKSDAVVSLSASASADLCYHFQDIAFTHLEDRLKRALDVADQDASTPEEQCTALVVVGGVAANMDLRRRLLDLLDDRSRSSGQASLPLIFPPVNLCTDNGVMVAWAGVEKLSMGISDTPHDQEVIPRWPLGTLRQAAT